MTYFTSDLHLQHNKPFIYEPRGFKNVTEMNETELNNINALVKPEDTLYILGDLVLGGPDADLSIIKRINCKDIRLIIGNHDTSSRIEYYKSIGIRVIGEGTHIKINKQRFFLCHYPVFRTPVTAARLDAKVINLFGHTHQKEKFYNNNPWMYCVNVDAHDNKPVSIDQIIQDCENQRKVCLNSMEEQNEQ